jgi:hypothetical protein
MTKSRKWIPWKKDRLFSIKLRNGHYALLQMLATKGNIAALNCFREADEWSGVRLTADKVLFIGVMLRSVTNRSVIAIHNDIVPVPNLEYPEEQIHIGNDFRTVTLWDGTEDERSFLMMGEGENSLRRIHRENGQPREEYTPISNNDFDLYKDLELTGLYDYPEFNERMFLCELFGRNVDPLKEIAFNRPVPLEYRTYIDIIAGKIPLRELGY